MICYLCMSSGYSARTVKNVILALMVNAEVNKAEQEKCQKVDKSSKIKGKYRKSQLISLVISPSALPLVHFREEANFVIEF